MTGELQRLNGGTDPTTSQDGWAIGGVATMFDTDDRSDTINGGFFQAAGSEHEGGAHFGLADGSVRFLSENINQGVYVRLGGASDGGPQGGVP